MLVWLILGTEEDADSCGTVDPEVELLPPGRLVVPPLGVGVKELPVGGAPGAARQAELGGIGAEFPGSVCSWLGGGAGAVWCLGGTSRLLSSCKVAK